MKTIDFKKMRTELKAIYKAFLENPEDESIKDKAQDYDREYGGLQAYENYLKDNPIPKNISEALGGLFMIYEYGIFGENHDLSQENILKKVKPIYENL